MIIKYFDKIKKEYVDLKVSAKVAHFIEKERNKNKVLTDDEFNKLPRKKQNEYSQLKFERSLISLNEMEEKGFEVAETLLFEDITDIREYEIKYLQSREYRDFRTALKKEIRNVFDEMSVQEQKVMYLRFFKECSLSQIAKIMKVDISSVRSYLQRGSKHIKYFLDDDIKEQDKLDRLKKMKREQKKFF